MRRRKLSAQQHTVLRYLDTAPGRTVVDVSRYEACPYTRTHERVTALIARGYVRRVQDGSRGGRLYVTALGRSTMRVPGESAAEARAVRLAARMAAKAPRPIKWGGLKDPPDYDLHTKCPSGHWDIMLSEREGWVIKPPWCWKTLRDADRIVVGHVDREVARLQAEALIRTDEKWPL